MNEVDRHDLEALKDLMEAKFDGVERTLHEMAKALEVLAVDRARKDAELNEVRQRFVDRVTFEQYRDSQDKALDAALVAVNASIKPIADFRAKALGFGTLLAVVSAMMGALIQTVIQGAFGG